MAKMDKRLQMITSNILQQASAESQAIISSANEIRQQRIAAFEEETLQRMYQNVQNEAGLIRLEGVGRLAEAQAKAYRQALRRREELAATVFASVKTRLFAYVSTGAYREQLLRELEQLSEAYDHSASVLYLRPDDLALAEELTAALPGCRAVGDESIKIGGWRLENSKARIRIDQTLETRLEQQRPWFYSHCGMRVTE